MAKKVFFLVGTLIIFNSCDSAKIGESLYQGYGFDKLHYEINIDKLEQYHKEITYDSISLIFKKEFNDKVEIFVNDNFYQRIALNSDSQSTLISSTEVKIKNVYGKNRILLRLANKKKMVEFSYDQRVPFYEISYYNDMWYINGVQGEITNVIEE